MRRSLIGVVVALVLVLVAGCSGDDDDGGSVLGALPGANGADDLVGRLPESPTVAYVDLDAARDQLGLATDADADVDDVDLDGDPERARLVGVAALGLPYLRHPYDVPLASALDTSLVHAAASTVTSGPNNGAAVVRTDQSFDDLADALADEGYEPDGDLLVRGGPTVQAVFPVVADGGDGTLVLAASEAEARAVLDGGAGTTPAIELLGRLPGIAVAAGATPDGLDCGAFGAGIDLEPAAGELVVFAGADPDPARAVPDPESNLVLRQVELDDRRVDGEYVRVELEYRTEEFPFMNPTHLVSGELVAGDIYPC